jgi:hypothetical protein
LEIQTDSIKEQEKNSLLVFAQMCVLVLSFRFVVAFGLIFVQHYAFFPFLLLKQFIICKINTVVNLFIESVNMIKYIIISEQIFDSF